MKVMTKIKTIIAIALSAIACVCLGFFVQFPTLFAKAENTTEAMFCAGAYIRYASEQNGIRFVVRVEKDGNLGNINDYTSGMLVIPTDKLDDGQVLDINAAKNKNNKGAKAAHVNCTGEWDEITAEDGKTYLQAAVYIYNIPETSYDRAFSFRGYYINDNGEYYYTENNDNSTRSLSYVALQAKLKEDIEDDFINTVLPQRVSVEAKLRNVDTYLYRVGNQNTVSLSSLVAKSSFAEANIPLNLEVTSDSEHGVKVTYNKNSTDSLKSTLKFEGTGVVTLTIKDKYSRNVKLNLEVIDAKNITSAESATANDVVLLNDISGTFTVSNGHTFYGNGFTVTLPTTSVQNVGNGFTGYISIGASQDDGIANGGNLDNVRIEGPVYPEMYIYRDQAKITSTSDSDYGDGYNMRYFKNSVIVYGGNCTISNSYISGSRTALCLRGGNNVVIENTTLSGGAYANMQICAGSKVTLRNLTTVQTDVSDSYGKGKTAHGLGVAVDSDVVDIYIEGDLNQHNWLNQTKWNEIVPSVYQSSFPKFFKDSNYSKYWHYLNGGSGSDAYVNLAFIFGCNWDTSKIHDNRSTVDYGTTNATISGVAGGVYTKVNTVGGNAITDNDLVAPVYTSNGFNPVAPKFTFDNSPNNDADDANDANDSYCVYSEASGTLKLGITGSSKTLDLSKVTITKAGTNLSYTAYLNGTKISGDSVTIKASAGAKQTLTFKATINNKGYDKDGNTIDGTIEYTWTVVLEVATLSFPAPEWNMGGTYQFDATKTCCFVEYSSDYGEAVPIYEGIKINYYDKSGNLVQKDFSGITSIPTGSANSNANAFTCTLSDGSTLTMKYSSGWKSGATTHQFTTYSKKVYIYPQSIDNSNYARNDKTSQDFDVKILYTFTDPNGQSISQTMRWYNAMANNNNVPEVQWKTFDSANGKKPSICVTPDTLVTLADGTQKEIQYVTYEDKLLVWDFYKGEYTVAPVSLLVNHGYDTYEIIELMFSDNSSIKFVGCHGAFNVELNEFVDINASNVASFVGDTFLKQVGNGFEKVTLVSYDIRKEYNESYTILSHTYHNAILNGVLTISPSFLAENLYEFFAVGENMKYDEESMKADIETYGLYTYEDFAEYMTYEQFEAWNIANMKIVVGKGWVTHEELVDMIVSIAVPNA